MAKKKKKKKAVKKKLIKKKAPSSKKIPKKKKPKKPSKKSANKKAQSQTFKNGEVLTCVWSVWISGTQLDWDKKNLIQSITIKETVDGSDTAVLEISDPNYSFIEDNIYIEANKIKIKMGWSSYKHRVEFNGYISHVDIKFPEDGIPRLTLTCMDKTFRMDRKEKSKTYKKTTTAKVVKKICKKYGFKCKIQKGYKFKKQATITQSNQTDIAFIQQLAQNEVHPFTARLVGKTFYYQKKGTLAKKAKYTLHYLEYPHDIISFEPKIDKISKDTVKKGKTSTKKKSTGQSQISDHYTGRSSVSSSGKGKGNSNNSSRGKGSGSTVSYNRNTRTWS